MTAPEKDSVWFYFTSSNRGILIAVQC